MAQQINLFNPALRPKREWVTAANMLMAMVAIAVVMLLYGTVVVRDSTRAQLRADTAAAGVKGLRDQLVTEAAVLKRGPDKALGDEIARLEAALNVRQQIIARYQGTGIGNTEGFSRYLEAFARQRTPGVWLTGMTLSGAGGDIFIRGRAQSADLLPAFVVALNREEALRGKAVRELQLEERTEARQPQRDAARPADAGAVRAPQAPANVRFIEFSLGTRASAKSDG